jgi:hypothetical protein
MGVSMTAGRGRADARARRQAPEHRNGEYLLLAFRQAPLGKRLPAVVIQRDREARRVDVNARDQRLFAQQEATVTTDC